MRKGLENEEQSIGYQSGNVLCNKTPNNTSESLVKFLVPQLLIDSQYIYIYRGEIRWSHSICRRKKIRVQLVMLELLTFCVISLLELPYEFSQLCTFGSRWPVCPAMGSIIGTIENFICKHLLTAYIVHVSLFRRVFVLCACHFCNSFIYCWCKCKSQYGCWHTAAFRLSGNEQIKSSSVNKIPWPFSKSGYRFWLFFLSWRNHGSLTDLHYRHLSIGHLSFSVLFYSSLC